MDDNDTEFRTARVRTLNDTFRTTLIGGKVAVTPSVASLPDGLKEKVVAMVREFSEFTEGDDPFGEHDFGAFTFDNHRYIWKIDYLDEGASRRSRDPSDPERTTRVLTIALASEY